MGADCLVDSPEGQINGEYNSRIRAVTETVKEMDKVLVGITTFLQKYDTNVTSIKTQV
jgi:hypothetical protein